MENSISKTYTAVPKNYLHDSNRLYLRIKLNPVIYTLEMKIY